MWVGQIAFPVPGGRVVVRATSSDVLGLVGGLPGAVTEATAIEAPLDGALVVYEQVSEGFDRGADVHTLWLAGRPVVRTRDTGRLLDAVASHVDAHQRRPDDHRVLIDGVAVVFGDRAAVLPVAARGALAAIERRLARLGVTVVDGPWVEVDPDRARIVVDGASHRVAAGGYALAGWLVADGTTPGPGTVIDGASRVIHGPADAQVLLERMALLLRAVDTRPVATDDAPAIVAALRALFGA